ncbi:PACE efflux transporter [Rhodobacteraceae bacterium CH30]|nr:PACE efflux transporter [Rhodobacteraceae bacterium CH30]
MSYLERCLHAILFEAIALAMLIPATSWIMGENHNLMSVVMISVSLTAMAWNIAFNYVFDRLVPGERIKRKLPLRILHSISFEAGLLLVSVPLVAWLMKCSLWQAFLLDAGTALFFLVYALAFNWLYDNLRARRRQQLA